MINFRKTVPSQVRHVQGDEPRRSLHRRMLPSSPRPVTLALAKFVGFALVKNRQLRRDAEALRSALSPRTPSSPPRRDASSLRRPLARGGPLVRGRRLRARPPPRARCATRRCTRDPRRPRGSPGPDPSPSAAAASPRRAPQRAATRFSTPNPRRVLPTTSPRRNRLRSVDVLLRDRPRRPRAGVEAGATSRARPDPTSTASGSEPREETPKKKRKKRKKG